MNAPKQIRDCEVINFSSKKEQTRTVTITFHENNESCEWSIGKNIIISRLLYALETIKYEVIKRDCEYDNE